MGRTACTEPQCLYSRAIPPLPLWAVRSVQSLSACTVQLYLHSPYGPYCLYRTSVPVQYSYTSTPPMDRTACTEPQCLYSRAIPPLPLWAVRSVQSLSACTVQLYLYSPYGPCGLYRALVPCTRVHFAFIFTVSSVHKMETVVCMHITSRVGRTAILYLKQVTITWYINKIF